jgi:hypothetical protein
LTSHFLPSIESKAQIYEAESLLDDLLTIYGKHDVGKAGEVAKVWQVKMRKMAISEHSFSRLLMPFSTLLWFSRMLVEER